MSLSACASRGPALPSDEPVELVGVPFFPQTDFDCGPAALATLLGHAGIDITPEELRPAVYIEGLRGSLQAELLAATRRHGLIPYPLAATGAGLSDELAAGRPVLVMQNLGLQRFPLWHYAVVVGYDPTRERVILRSGEERRRQEKARRFMRSWARAEHWAFVALEPGALPARAQAQPYLRALLDSAAHLDATRLDEGYEAALTRWPEDALVLFAAANHARDRGRVRRAVALYQRLLAIEPEHAAARNNLAYAWLAADCLPRALAEAQAALALQRPGDEFYAAIAATVDELLAAQAGPNTGACVLP